MSFRFSLQTSREADSDSESEEPKFQRTYSFYHDSEDSEKQQGTPTPPAVRTPTPPRVATTPKTPSTSSASTAFPFVQVKNLYLLLNKISLPSIN